MTIIIIEILTTTETNMICLPHRTDKLQINYMRCYLILINYKNERIEKNKAFGERNELHDLIDTIPEDKRKEMYEMINLRIKSWEWKNKDRCEIIESSTSMDGMHW